MKDQAKETFTGTYRASNGLNSSVTLEVNEGPGVHVTSWISNGTEMMTNLYLSAYAEFRLVPSDLKYEENGITYHKYILQALFNEYGEENRGGDFWSVCKSFEPKDTCIFPGLSADKELQTMITGSRLTGSCTTIWRRTRGS